jgi:hypothetical protein
VSIFLEVAASIALIGFQARTRSCIPDPFLITRKTLEGTTGGHSQQ